MKLTTNESKFFKGQRIEVSDNFVLDCTEYRRGQILVIKKITKNCFVAPDGHKVSRIWVDDDLYFTSDFIMEHFKPCRLELFRSILQRLKKEENSELHNLEVLKKEADIMSDFFGADIIEKSRVDCSREDEISKTEKRLSLLKMEQAYYAAMDIAVQRWLIHCEESKVLDNIDGCFSNKVDITLNLTGSKLIQVTEDGILYGEPSISDDNLLISFKIDGAYESQAVAAKYCCDRMKRAIQLSILSYLKESEFCIAEDRNDDK